MDIPLVSGNKCSLLSIIVILSFKWSFRNEEATVMHDNVDLCMQIYGYSLFISILIAPISAGFMFCYSKCDKSKATQYTLVTELGLVVILSTLVSIQMALDIESTEASLINCIFAVFEYALLRTLFFTARSMVSHLICDQQG